MASMKSCSHRIFIKGEVVTIELPFYGKLVVIELPFMKKFYS